MRSRNQGSSHLLKFGTGTKVSQREPGSGPHSTYSRVAQVTKCFCATNRAGIGLPLGANEDEVEGPGPNSIVSDRTVLTSILGESHLQGPDWEGVRFGSQGHSVKPQSLTAVQGHSQSRGGEGHTDRRGKPDNLLFLQSLAQTLPECGLPCLSPSGSSDYFLLDASTRAPHLCLPTEQLFLGEAACHSIFSVDTVCLHGAVAQTTKKVLSSRTKEGV